MNRPGFVGDIFIRVMQHGLTRFVDHTAFHIQRAAYLRVVEASDGC